MTIHLKGVSRFIEDEELKIEELEPIVYLYLRRFCLIPYLFLISP